jgi:hypothetical protein
MAPRFSSLPNRRRSPHEIEIRGFWNLYLVAIGIVVLLGLVTGTLYIAWRLLSSRFGS